MSYCRECRVNALIGVDFVQLRIHPHRQRRIHAPGISHWQSCPTSGKLADSQVDTVLVRSRRTVAVSNLPDGCPSFFFFGGLSWPLTTALLSHLFSYNIQWFVILCICRKTADVFLSQECDREGG